MSFAVKVYEAFKDDEVKAKVLAEFIESVEQIIGVIAGFLKMLK